MTELPHDHAWFDEVERRFELGPDHRALLAAARQAWSRWQEIVGRIDADGLLLPGRWGLVAHPLLGPEARARQAVVAAVKALNLPEA